MYRWLQPYAMDAWHWLALRLSARTLKVRYTRTIQHTYNGGDLAPLQLSESAEHNQLLQQAVLLYVASMPELLKQCKVRALAHHDLQLFCAVCASCQHSRSLHCMIAI